MLSIRVWLRLLERPAFPSGVWTLRLEVDGEKERACGISLLICALCVFVSVVSRDVFD